MGIENYESNKGGKKGWSRERKKQRSKEIKIVRKMKKGRDD